MPAMKKKPPSRVARFQVPVGLIAPADHNVVTPFAEACCAIAGPPAKAVVAMNGHRDLNCLLLR